MGVKTSDRPVNVDDSDSSSPQHIFPKRSVSAYSFVFRVYASGHFTVSFFQKLTRAQIEQNVEKLRSR